jgi:alkylhydroperoxidase family enzyme
MARVELPAGRGPEVARALAAAPHFAGVVAAYEDAVAQSPLAPRLHELVRYRVALLNQCTVCLGYRRDDSGVSEETLAQVADWRRSSAFTPTERVALDFTEQFCGESAAISDELIAELEQLLPPGHVVELALVVGKYVAMGRFMQVLGLDQSCDVADLQAATRR